MDKTPIYAEMCEKAIEIQELWQPQWGDFIADKGDYSDVSVLLSLRDQKAYPPVVARSELTWLPRQDQLQEMTKHLTSMSKHLWFSEWVYEIFGSYTEGEAERIDILSLEQLWLMFVMAENYNKQWDFEKKEWVNL